MYMTKQTATGRLADILARYRDIEYGYISDGVRYNTIDTPHFRDKYKLKSKKDVLRDRLAICLDASRAMAYDLNRAGIPAKELYMESETGGEYVNPAHSTTIVDAGTDGVYALERGLARKGLINKFRDMEELLSTYSEAVPGGGVARFWYIDKPIKPGTALLDYMRLAKQREIK